MALLVDGKLIEIPTGQTEASVDFSYNYHCQVVGIKVFFEAGFLYGDYGTVTVHHPVTDVELKKFGNNCYFPTGIPETTVFVADEGSALTATLKFRVKITATNSLGRKAIVWLITKGP